MKIQMLHEASLRELKRWAEQKITLYSKTKVTWEEYLHDGQGIVELHYEVESIPQLKVTDERKPYFDDVENAILIHKSMRNLPKFILSDERFWTHQTHFVHWDYMRKRWRITSNKYKSRQKRINVVLSRYFFQFMRTIDRAELRNGLSRLYWITEATYDEQAADPYELTRLAFQTQDVVQNLTENNFARAPQIVRGTLRAMRDLDEEGVDWKSRLPFRSLVKHLNLSCGARMVELLTDEEIHAIATNTIKKALASK